MDMSRYIDLFLTETREHLALMDEGLSALPREPEGGTINELFRHAHSIKGMSASMGYVPIRDIAHGLESALDRVKKKEIRPSEELANAMARALDGITEMVGAVERGEELPADVTAWLEPVSAASLGELPVPAPPSSTSSPPALPEAANAPAGPPLEPSASEAKAAPPTAEAFARTLRIRAEGLDRFLEGVGELMVHRGRLARLLEPLADPAARQELDRLKKIAAFLFREVMGMRMLPFEAIAHRFVRSVRDLSRELSRPLSLTISGRDVRLDRAMLDELVDPINHILRNCADHGIEDPAEREAASKPATGSIAIRLVRGGDHVTIRMEDDGRGMDPARIKRHALEGRFITRAQFEAISDQEALMLTTIPGFSTARKVTELSGRGVGMDVVRTKVESLGGRLHIHSRPGIGTAIELSMPLTIAIIQAFIVRAAGRDWAVPISSIRRTMDLDPEPWAGRGAFPLLRLGEEDVEMFDLASLLAGLDRHAAWAGTRAADPPAPNGPRQALIASSRDRCFGVLVDSVLGQQDVVVKPLGPPLDELREYSGATVLEDGRVALILDLDNLVSTHNEPSP